MTAEAVDPTDRFNPTPVGNTSSDVYEFARVQPHTRGKYIGAMIFPLSSAGSTPHLWEILHSYSIIEAVGSTPPPWEIR